MKKEIEDLWTVKELAKMAHHNLYEITSLNPDIDHERNEQWFEEVSLIPYKLQCDAKVESDNNILRFEQQYRDEAINRKTGYKVMIKDVVASGDQFKTLVKGDILDVLDMSKQDPRVNRGVWVWGNGEPVKLLNEDNYNEYELVLDETTPMNIIATEILKMVSNYEPKKQDIFGLIGLIELSLAEKENKTSALHDNLTTWLDDNDYPRRMYRNKIETFLFKVLKNRLN